MVLLPLPEVHWGILSLDFHGWLNTRWFKNCWKGLQMLGRPNHVTRGYGILPSSLLIWPLSTMVIWISNTCRKTSAVLTVLSGQRVSTIHKFKLSNLQLTDTVALFNITEPLKQSTPTRKPQPFVFHRYPHNEQLCPVRLVQAYWVKQTSLPVVASYDAFFLTHRRPHHPASKDTIARWVKNVLQLSGVNVDIYKLPLGFYLACKTWWGTPGRYFTGWPVEILGLLQSFTIGWLKELTLLLLSYSLTVFWVSCQLHPNACIAFLFLGIAVSHCVGKCDLHSIVIYCG